MIDAKYFYEAHALRRTIDTIFPNSLKTNHLVVS